MKNNMLVMLIMRLFEINNGRKIWNSLKSKYHIRDNNSYLVLLPGESVDYERIFFEYYSKVFERNKDVIIVTTNKIVETVALLYENNNKMIVEVVSNKESDALLKFYAFMDFYHRFYSISLDYPEERRCSHLIGKNGITVEDLVVMGAMRVDYDRYKKIVNHPLIPKYNGEDCVIARYIRKTY